MRRAVLALDLVLDDLGTPGEPLLQLRLEVHGVLERLLDLSAEGLHDSRGHAVPAEREVGSADRGLADRGEDAVARDQRVGALAGLAGARSCSRRAGRCRARPRAGLARDALGAQLGQPARAERLEARVDVGGDREAQDDVPQEREPLVRLAALLGPRRMGERLPGQILRQLVDK